MSSLIKINPNPVKVTKNLTFLKAKDVNKKYVDDKLACNTIDILNELCKIHSFEPARNKKEKKALQEVGAVIEFIEIVEKLSTSSIIEKIIKSA